MDDNLALRRKLVIEEKPKSKDLIEDWHALKCFDEVRAFCLCSSHSTVL